jgi:ribosomal protein S20
MTFRRWMILPAAAVAALLIGAVAVSAQTSSPGTGSNYGQVFVNKLAAILHLTPTQTQNDLKQAALQTVDQMLKDGRITESQADALKSRINSGEGFGFPFRHGGGFGDRTLKRSLRDAELNAIAGALHMTPSDLMTQLRSGQTLSQLEQAKGVSDSAVRSAVHTAAKPVLDNAVKTGSITQAQEDAILSSIDHGQLIFRGFGHGFGPEHAPQGSPQPSPSGSV